MGTGRGVLAGGGDMVVVCEATLAAVGLDWGTGGVHFVTAIVVQSSLCKEAAMEEEDLVKICMR